MKGERVKGGCEFVVISIQALVECLLSLCADDLPNKRSEIERQRGAVEHIIGRVNYS